MAKMLNKLRSLADNYQRTQQHESAIFWCGQAASASGGEAEDVLRMAETLIALRQYHRASHLVKQAKLDAETLKGCYLTANAVYLAGDHEEALAIIEAGSDLVSEAKKEADKSCLCSLLVLKGKVLEALDNRALAADSFKEALRLDVFCHEAFQALVKHQILSADDEARLLESLPLREQAGDDEELAKLVSFLYAMSTKKYDKPDNLSVPEELQSHLKNNMDLSVAMAERNYYNCDYTQCYRITSRVMKEDPYHSDCLPIHISCLIELQKPNDLFHLAHKLVDLYPEWVVSWFAVGCYYFLAGKHELSRRYLSKATQLDRVFGPSWLAYGHSFALENEHDQAMAAYFKACQLMRGCHLPLLYIGVEYGLTNNSKLAERFFCEALEIAPKDPFVLHELGVTHFQNQDYQTAERYFTNALTQVKCSPVSGKWEPLLNNLGHTCRKLGKYKEALGYHQQALVLLPLSASTYSAIGYVQTLQFKLMDAVESFHKALSLRRDDAFSTTMLNNVVEQLMQEVTPFPDYPEQVPKFKVNDEASSVAAVKHEQTESDLSLDRDFSTDIEMADVSHGSI